MAVLVLYFRIALLVFLKICNYFTGIWTSTVFLGTFFGSTLGGVLVHVYGFPTTATGSVTEVVPR